MYYFISLLAYTIADSRDIHQSIIHKKISITKISGTNTDRSMPRP